MLNRLISFCFFLLLPFALAPGQVLTTSIRLTDWGLTDAKTIELAQFSIVHLRTGDELQIQSLYDARVFELNGAVVDRFLTVADFSGEFVNLLGGSYSTFAGSGSSAEAHHLLSSERIPSLNIAFRKTIAGYCGLWMHLYNSAAPRNLRKYVDSRPYGFLAIAVRGTAGGEKVLLKLADDVWNDKEDAVPVGDLGQFTPSKKIEERWQVAKIPVRRIPASLHKDRLASIVLEVEGPQSGSFELGGVAWYADSTFVPPPPKPRARTATQALERALWVWETKYLFQRNMRDSLVRFLKSEKIDNVFLSLPYDPVAAKTANGLTLKRAELGPVVLALNAAGVKVHALTGDKDFIQPDARPFVRNSIQNIVDYNASVSPGEQFSAIHLDVEPYLLPGFGSPRQLWYVRNFLETLQECANIAHTGGMRIGVDMPPWFDSPNELTHLMMTGVIGEVKKPLYEHIIDLMDNVTLMDYRTTAEGDNGIVWSAVKELEYAEQQRKQVFVGIETLSLPNETVLTFRRPLSKGLPETRPGRQFVLVAQHENAMVASLVTSKTDILKFLDENKLTENSVLYWPVERSTTVLANQTSFAELGLERMKQVLRTAEPQLRAYASFGGYAIHFYRSYRELIGRK